MATLKVLNIWPQPTVEEAVAINAALHKMYGPVECIRQAKWLRAGRSYGNEQPAAPAPELSEPTKWSIAARIEALDDAL